MNTRLSRRGTSSAAAWTLGGVNSADIDPFVLALTGWTAHPAQYPSCNGMNGNCNHDGKVNFADLNPFVAILAGA